MEIGTSITNGTRKIKPGVNDTIAVPLYVVVIPFFVGLPVILKSVIVWICGAVPFVIIMPNVALKAGELELIFLNSHIPERIHKPDRVDINFFYTDVKPLTSEYRLVLTALTFSDVNPAGWKC
jgi:hypothetical protein